MTAPTVLLIFLAVFLCGWAAGRLRKRERPLVRPKASGKREEDRELKNLLSYDGSEQE